MISTLCFFSILSFVTAFDKDLIRSRYASIHIPSPTLGPYSGFRIRTQEEIQREAAVREFLKQLEPTPTPKPCEMLEQECLVTEGCSWCIWPSPACHTSEVAELLPTTTNCIVGGIPFLLEELTANPVTLCQLPWAPTEFQECWYVLEISE